MQTSWAGKGEGGGGLGQGLTGGGCLSNGELPFAPQLALKSFCYPGEGGKSHCDALCS